jgi:hypothetical protein
MRRKRGRLRVTVRRVPVYPQGLSCGAPPSYSCPVNENQKTRQKARRVRRLGAALRENLKRRKAQAKARSVPAHGERGGAPHDSAGFVEDKQSR